MGKTIPLGDSPVCVTAHESRNFRHYLFNWSDSEEGNGEGQKTQLLPQGAWVAKTSCTNREAQQGWGSLAGFEELSNSGPVC